MTTYYATHNAAGGGAGTSVGDPFTLQELFDTVTNSDLGLICNTGTYTPSAQIDVDNGANVGTVSARTQIRGAASDGTDDGTIATISGSSLGASTDLISIDINYYYIANLRITGATRYNVYSDSDGSIWENCRLDNATSHGFWQQTNLDTTIFKVCEIDNNGGAGYTGGFDSRGCGIWESCSIHDNGSFGLKLTPVGRMIDTIVFKNGGDGVRIDMNSHSTENGAIINCTIDGNTGDGIESVNSTIASDSMSIADTIISNNGGYGINLNSTPLTGFQLRLLCVPTSTGANSLGQIDAGSLPADTVTDNPDFVDRTTGGSEDYTPQGTGLKVTRSPISGVGGDSYKWVGAIQPDTASSGGGLLGVTAASMSGGMRA